MEIGVTSMGSGVMTCDDAASNPPPGFLALDPEDPSVAPLIHHGDVMEEYDIEREPIAR